MTTDTDLGALIARVEGATGPDRELDKSIWRALGHCVHDMRLSRFEVEPGEYDVASCCTICGDFKGAAAPKFTASLDAAMSLVPKGRPFDLGCEDDGQSDWVADLTCFAPKGSDDNSLYVRGTTPALALVAAALRARVGVGDDKGVGA